MDNVMVLMVPDLVPLYKSICITNQFDDEYVYTELVDREGITHFQKMTIGEYEELYMEIKSYSEN